MEYVLALGKAVLGTLAETVAEALIKPTLTLVKWTIVKLFPQSRFARLLMSWEVRFLRWVRVTWTHEADALRIVNTFRVIDDQVHELMDPFDVYMDSDKGLTMVPNETRIQREIGEYGESIPKDVLDTFAGRKPLSRKAGKYNKQVWCSGCKSISEGGRECWRRDRVSMAAKDLCSVNWSALAMPGGSLPCHAKGRHDLLEVLDDRYARAGTILASQSPR